MKYNISSLLTEINGHNGEKFSNKDYYREQKLFSGVDTDLIIDTALKYAKKSDISTIANPYNKEVPAILKGLNGHLLNIVTKIVNFLQEQDLVEDCDDEDYDDEDEEYGLEDGLFRNDRTIKKQYSKSFKKFYRSHNCKGIVVKNSNRQCELGIAIDYCDKDNFKSVFYPAIREYQNKGWDSQNKYWFVWLPRIDSKNYQEISRKIAAILYAVKDFINFEIELLPEKMPILELINKEFKKLDNPIVQALNKQLEKTDEIEEDKEKKQNEKIEYDIKISAITNKKLFKITFVSKYGFELLDKVKLLKNRSFNSEKKCWTAPINQENVNLLQRFYNQRGNYEYLLSNKVQEIFDDCILEVKK